MLPGAKEYLDGLPVEDRIVILTSRTKKFRKQTLEFLNSHFIRYDDILFNMPMGERIVVNDRKPSGVDMAIAMNIERDEFRIPSIRREK